MDFSVESKDDGDWSVVHVRGEVDVFTAPKLRERIIELVERGRYNVIVDLEAVTFMDSTGLGILVGCLKRIKEKDGSLVLAGPQRPVMRVLTITGLARVFPIHETVSQATGSP
jgi:anti-sigma B factor antagonist